MVNRPFYDVEPVQQLLHSDLFELFCLKEFPGSVDNLSSPFTCFLHSSFHIASVRLAYNDKRHIDRPSVMFFY